MRNALCFRGITLFFIKKMLLTIANTESAAPSDSSKGEIPVSTLLQDSSEEKTTSIYDRYKSVEADK